ncbi:MAG: hypothetical protein QJT81_07005 [Candidatus Thiothrix putei]|uniref:Uncharacterized protein n=1 Tax=Candidatus Thiothrix putei TaxID=3080811 RepID=A0AA95KJT4_9GAMM|nr:MAG: hypothetical protein QJT81_07005 [Candidatus Thiothrix putei]
MAVILGSMQALETIKLIVGSGETLTGRVLLFDGSGWDSNCRVILIAQFVAGSYAPHLRVPSNKQKESFNPINTVGAETVC